MDVRVGFAQLDATAPLFQVNVGFAQLDATAAGFQVNVGFAQLDATAAGFQVNVGFADFDAQHITAPFPTPNYGGGGSAGTGGGRRKSMDRYLNYETGEFNIPIAMDNESDDEDVIMAILLQVAAHELC
jgi:hypothetical protein